MQKPDLPINEAQRLQAVRALGLLDSLPEKRFDTITALAKQMFAMPVVWFSLIDDERQWIKSRQGSRLSELPRSESFCGHTILGDDVLQVGDTLADPRFCDNPLVTGDTGFRCYVGCPVRSQDGNNIGTLCLFDTVPRQFDTAQMQLLKMLVTLLECELETLQTAHHDDLTGLINARGLLFLGDHSTRLCYRTGISLSMILLDINQFGLFNQDYGEDFGDLVLLDTAMLLRQSFRESDMIARVGGDQFVVILLNADERRGKTAMGRFQQVLKEYNQLQGRVHQLSFRHVVVELDYGHHGGMVALLQDARARLAEDYLMITGT
ncbi:sensor domain-containing diguanylate cyclase [Shewanella sp. GXUN23E]|uniref:sensor domain-containing diguanylate cyclase n=1 Tax=Shewanella sp. GXUN23E TaxID=3422498 RepID=UPI003D7EF774